MISGLEERVCHLRRLGAQLGSGRSGGPRRGALVHAGRDAAAVRQGRRRDEEDVKEALEPKSGAVPRADFRIGKDLNHWILSALF